jgi:hypothetical protein
MWSDSFVSDSQRCSDLLPGGPDPIEQLDIELYDRITLTPPSLFFSGTYETLLLGRVTVPLEFVRLQSIQQWFTISPSELICSMERWRVALSINVRLRTTAPSST